MAATRRGRKRKPDFFGVKPEKSLSQIRIDEVLSDEWRNLATAMRDAGHTVFVELICSSPRLIVDGQNYPLGDSHIMPMARELTHAILNN